MTRKYEKKAFPFTDKQCRDLQPDGEQKYSAYSDSLCPGLKIIVSQFGNHSYNFYDQKGSKVIGGVFDVTVKEAREIVNNIKQNHEEFLRIKSDIKIPLSVYFRKNGPFPYGEQAEEDDKIKELREQIKALTAQRDAYRDKLREIWEILGGEVK